MNAWTLELCETAAVLADECFKTVLCPSLLLLLQATDSILLTKCVS